MKFKIRFRSLSFLFDKKLYSFYRWNNPYRYENYLIYCIDIGSVVIVKEEKI